MIRAFAERIEIHTAMGVARKREPGAGIKQRLEAQFKSAARVQGAAVFNMVGLQKKAGAAASLEPQDRRPTMGALNSSMVGP